MIMQHEAEQITNSAMNEKDEKDEKDENYGAGGAACLRIKRF